jgi:hypothetical protein
MICICLSYLYKSSLVAEMMMMFIGTEILVTQFENKRSRVQKCLQPDKVYISRQDQGGKICLLRLNE